LDAVLTLLGLKFGVAKDFDNNNWEVAGAIGLALSLVTDDDKVKQHEVFIDGEVNRYLGAGFIGTGLSLWDLNHSDTFTPAWLFHFGVRWGRIRRTRCTSSAKAGCSSTTSTTSRTTTSSGAAFESGSSQSSRDGRSFGAARHRASVNYL
jgi:hypothetical protein